MCTLTWWRSPEPGRDGYEVFFNRDEKKTRPLALPPEALETGGVRFLAPRDGAAGGTWLLVNECGITVALLNWYSRETIAGVIANRISRGELVMNLADLRSPESLPEKLAGFDPKRFQPFRLLVFFPGNEDPFIDYWQWSGAGEFERVRCPPMPVCSSSFDRSAVVAGREARLRETLAGGGGPEVLWDYHHNNGSPEATAYTVRMNRPDAQTWSISRITVAPESVQFGYEAESLDLSRAHEWFEKSLERERP